MLASVLVAVGELAQVPGPEMAVYTDDLFSITIDMLLVSGVLAPPPAQCCCSPLHPPLTEVTECSSQVA